MARSMGNDKNFYGAYSDSNKNPNMLWEIAYSTRTDYTRATEGAFTPSDPAPAVLVYDRQIAQLQKEIKELRDMLSYVIQSQEIITEDPTIILRDIPVSQAKEEIAKYFRENDGRLIDEGELIDELGIEPLTVVQACRILVEEGKIG